MRRKHDNRIDIDFGIILRNGKYLERVGKFCHQGEALNGNGGSATASDTMCMGKI